MGNQGLLTWHAPADIQQTYIMAAVSQEDRGGQISVALLSLCD